MHACNSPHSSIQIQQLMNDRYSQQQHQTESVSSPIHPMPPSLVWISPPPPPPPPPHAPSLVWISPLPPPLPMPSSCLDLPPPSMPPSIVWISLPTTHPMPPSLVWISPPPPPPYTGFYWRAWANRKVLRWDLNWDNVGTFLFHQIKISSHLMLSQTRI